MSKHGRKGNSGCVSAQLKTIPGFSVTSLCHQDPHGLSLPDFPVILSTPPHPVLLLWLTEYCPSSVPAYYPHTYTVVTIALSTPSHSACCYPQPSAQCSPPAAASGLGQPSCLCFHFIWVSSVTAAILTCPTSDKMRQNLISLTWSVSWEPLTIPGMWEITQ